MVDASLDDYIRGNNFQIQIRNDNQKSATPPFRGKRSNQMGMAARQKRNNLSARIGARNEQTFNVTLGGGSKKVLDARQKISQRKTFQEDARGIIDSKAQVLDARSKITNLKIQKGTFDAREKLKIHKPQNPQPQVKVTGLGTVTVSNPVNPGTICRTVDNTGNSVEVNEGNIQITRNIDGNYLSVSNSDQIMDYESPKLRDDFQITKTVSQNFQVPHVNPVRGPVIKVRNEQYTGGVVINNDFVDQTADRTGDSPERFESFVVRDLHLPVTKTVNRPSNPLFSGAVDAKPKMATAVKRRAQLSKPPPLRKPVTVFSDDLDEQVKSVPITKKSKSAPVLKESMEVDEQTEDTDSADILSPLQGFRVLVTNLHTIVTQDDIIELFGSVGALKKAKLLKQGAAEVVYVKKEDALRAEKKYHTRELDGQPMHVKLVTPVTATVKEVDSLSTGSEPVASPLKLAKSSGAQKEKMAPDVELPLIHRALFKTGAPASNKPVTFTVKI